MKQTNHAINQVELIEEDSDWSLSYTHAYTHKQIQLHVATLVFSNLGQKQAFINGLLWVPAACLELYRNLVGGGRQ